MRRAQKIAGLLILLMILLTAAGGALAARMVLPEGLTAVGTDLFYGDQKLTEAVLPNGVKKINAGAFAESGLTTINFPSSLEYISEYAFTNCDLQHITVEKGTYAYSWLRAHGYLPEYRALLIGEKTFLRGGGTETVLRNGNDVTNMDAMLKKVYSPLGNRYTVTRKFNLSYSGVQSAIRNTFAGTMDQDVSLFFIATHGKSRGDGDLEMAFTGNPEDADAVAAYLEAQYLSFETLASWLTENVKGEVIVILESCGAGSAIYEEVEGNHAASGDDGERRTAARSASGTEQTEEMLEAADRAFVSAAIRAFAAAQQTVPASSRGLKANSTGDLRLPKYYVLAAAAHHEESYGFGNGAEHPQNLFTMWLIQGIGSVNHSPADTNPKNNVLTLNELYTYVQQFDESYPYPYWQHVQCYPANSSYAMFLLQ